MTRGLFQFPTCHEQSAGYMLWRLLHHIQVSHYTLGYTNAVWSTRYLTCFCLTQQSAETPLELDDSKLDSKTAPGGFCQGQYG